MISASRSHLSPDPFVTPTRRAIGAFPLQVRHGNVLRLAFHHKPGQVRHVFQLLLHEPFPEVKNPVVQGDKLTNELASLVDAQDTQEILKVIKNDGNGGHHPLRI